MLEYIYSIFGLLVLFFVSVYVLVKLYEHGVRDWFVQTVLVLFGAWYFISKPNDYVFSSSEKLIAFVIAMAAIFTVDRNSVSTTSNNNSQHSDYNENEQHGHSLVHHILNAFMIYAIWSYFTGNDDNENNP